MIHAFNCTNARSGLHVCQVFYSQGTGEEPARYQWWIGTTTHTFPIVSETALADAVSASCGQPTNLLPVAPGPVWLVQYSILDKHYSVGFSTREAAETALRVLANAGRTASIVEPKQTITRDQLLSYPDGTWIMTNHDVTKILDTARWTEPKPSGFLNGFWWRRKELMDQLGIVP